MGVSMSGGEDRPAGGGADVDRELWRERADDYYSDYIFVTPKGEIGVNCGGSVIVAPLRRWFKAMEAARSAAMISSSREGRRGK